MKPALQRDANWRTIDNNDAFLLTSDWAFEAASTGATGAHALFEVTGVVALNVIGLCTADLTSGGSATVEVGTATSTAALCSQQTATNIDDHEVWHDSVLAIGGQVAGHTHIVDEDVILTVATAAVSGGAMKFIAFWRPISADGNVTVSTPA
jgi:hypothetical protein